MNSGKKYKCLETFFALLSLIDSVSRTASLVGATSHSLTLSFHSSHPAVFPIFNVAGLIHRLSCDLKQSGN